MSLLNFMDDSVIQVAKINLRKKGYYIIENVYDKNFCNTIIKFMDDYTEGDAQFFYQRTETRIYGAEHKTSLLKEFYEECNTFLSHFLKRKMEANTLLAIKNKPLPTQDDVLVKGRWHIDSFKNQLKIFLFLSDTTEYSGPFEFVPTTHKNSFKLKMMLRGLYFKFTDIIRSGKRQYQKLDDEQLEKLVFRKHAHPLPVICKGGTILLVNTSAIHRARPCLEIGRYALTTYF